MNVQAVDILWSEPQTAALIRLRESVDLTSSQIAARIGACQSEVDIQIWTLIRQGRIAPRLLNDVRLGRPSPVKRSWAAIRAELAEMYAAGWHHQTMAWWLHLTRTQVQTQLAHLFREGLPRRLEARDRGAI